MIDIREYLFETNPYAKLDFGGFRYNTHQLNLPLSVLNLVQSRRPLSLIEVGSWKGCSAILMANQLRDHGIPGHILCIDTWLGAEEMWRKPDRGLHGRYTGLKLKNGYPSFYYDFLRNVVSAGHHDRITPFPTTSSIAASLLESLGYRADLIYLDASHSYQDAIQDMRGYWNLLSGHGILIGDDYSPGWGVKQALDEFSLEIGVGFDHYEDQGWSLPKGGIHQDDVGGS